MASDIPVIKRFTEEVFLGGNLDLVDELVAESFVDHDPPPGLPPTKDGVRQLAAMVTGAFSDMESEFDEYIDTTDGCVVESWAMVGTHSGDAFGLPPSNQRVRIRGVEIFRCENGKIVEHWGAVDMSDVAEKAMSAG